MKVILIKTVTGLIPGDEDTEKWYKKLKLGAAIHEDFKVMRNYEFHKKVFALFNLAYENWEPGEINTRWGKPQKNFKTFRKNLTVLAGYGHPVFNIDGTFKMEADSISFAKMEQDEFEKLFSNLIDVILKKIPSFKNHTEKQMKELVDKVLAFC